METIKEKIRNQDSYGHQISLNFNRKGETNNTVFGGIVSIILKSILACIFVSKMIVMFNYDDTTIRNYKVPIDN